MVCSKVGASEMRGDLLLADLGLSESTIHPLMSGSISTSRTISNRDWTKPNPKAILENGQFGRIWSKYVPIVVKTCKRKKENHKRLWRDGKRRSMPIHGSSSCGWETINNSDATSRVFQLQSIERWFTKKFRLWTFMVIVPNHPFWKTFNEKNGHRRCSCALWKKSKSCVMNFKSYSYTRSWLSSRVTIEKRAIRDEKQADDWTAR